MLQELINHNEDLRKLLNEGYELEERGGYLIVHHIPYVANINKTVVVKDDGAFVVKINCSGTTLNKPFDHTVYFIGEFPCNIDGSHLSGVVNNSESITLVKGVIANHYLSNKPISGEEISYFEKIKRYEAIISRPAMALNHHVTSKTYKPIINSTSDSPFVYVDTWSSRYDIQNINDKLSDEKVAIIGLGGTGAYLLDFLSKTPVKEIHLIDGDKFCTHNAFRAPGAPSLEILNENQSKVKYYFDIYSKMHNGIITHDLYLDDDIIDEVLNGLNFVFISIDNDKARMLIINYLVSHSIPFIDTGIGLYAENSKISGQVRMTCCLQGQYENIKQHIPFVDTQGDEYKSNIQISELNALNAILAIIKWKQKKGFYCELSHYANVVFSINDMSLPKR